ncbi:putative non-canonical purine NTP phosphatase [Bienertia sinuspersici]
MNRINIVSLVKFVGMLKMKNPKNYKWKKNDGTGTMSRHLRSEHGLGLEGEEGSSGGGQAQLHGYAFDMPGAGMPFVYNGDRMIAEFAQYTYGDIRVYKNYMQYQANLSSQPRAAVKRLLDNMKVKWCAYFTEFPPIYAIAAILDPGFKLEGIFLERIKVLGSVESGLYVDLDGKDKLEHLKSLYNSYTVEDAKP